MTETEQPTPPAALGMALRAMAERLTAVYYEMEAALPAVADIAGQSGGPRREEMAEEGSVHLSLALGQIREGALRVDAVATLVDLAAAPWADYPGAGEPPLSLTVIFPGERPAEEGGRVTAEFAVSEPAAAGEDGAPTSGSG